MTRVERENKFWAERALFGEQVLYDLMVGEPSRISNTLNDVTQNLHFSAKEDVAIKTLSTWAEMQMAKPKYVDITKQGYTREQLTSSDLQKDILFKRMGLDNLSREARCVEQALIVRNGESRVI